MSKLEAIKKALEAEGWEISSVSVPSNYWWALEIWQLTSRWSPVGMVIHLILLLDPMADIAGITHPEAAVWAVGLSVDMPETHLVESVPIRPHFRERLPEVVARAAALRMDALHT